MSDEYAMRLTGHGVYKTLCSGTGRDVDLVIGLKCPACGWMFENSPDGLIPVHVEQAVHRESSDQKTKSL